MAYDQFNPETKALLAGMSQEREAFYNPDPDTGFSDLEELRNAMRAVRPDGDDFIDHLLEGKYFQGKGVWVNEAESVREAYEAVIAAHPYLKSENAYGEGFRRDGVRKRGDNPIRLMSISDLSDADRMVVERHALERQAGRARPIALFAGGPAAKIGAILTAMHGHNVDTRFVIDGAEQSNESGSASYEHINHANALNDEPDNTGLGILGTALKRALVGERNPNVALKTGYARVDLWPRGFKLNDIPIYAYNEVHGWVNRVRRAMGWQTDHDKSRIASKLSTDVLSHIERESGVTLRLDDDGTRAVHIYFTEEHHRHSLRDNKILDDTVGLKPRKMSEAEIADAFGPKTAANIASADIFPENSCLRHGFDQLCRQILVEAGGRYEERVAVRDVVIDPTDEGNVRAVAVRLEHLETGRTELRPVDHLCLTLGPTATYTYASRPRGLDRLRDSLGANAPLPRQTIATGATMHVLFRITDREAFKTLPHTDLKQTHFVEIAEHEDWLLVKLTAGGNIGLPVYSRSYAISALASMFRVLTPETGLSFHSVVNAWPCARGVNGPNNGQVVRIAENAAIRFAEGGTGMSKMGTNAQTLIDMAGVNADVPAPLRLTYALYKHTIVDRRARIAGRLQRGRRRSVESYAAPALLPAE